MSLRWRNNGRDGVSNHDCLLYCLFRRRSKKTSKLRVTGLCAGNSPGTGEFPAQMASNAENVSISWRHHVYSSWGKLFAWKIVVYRFLHNIYSPLKIIFAVEEFNYLSDPVNAMTNDDMGPFYYHGLTVILAWICHRMSSKVWDEIACLFPNFNGTTVEVWEWISKLTPHIKLNIITGVNVNPCQ